MARLPIRNRMSGAVCATALLLHAGASAADVTADDVWAAMGGTAGKEVSAGSVTRTAEGIVITDLTATGDKQEAIGFTTATLETLTLRNLGDGRVEVLPGGVGLFKATAKGKAGETLETEGRMTAPNARIVISGTPEKMLADITLPELRGDFTTTAPGQKAPVVTVAVAAKGLTFVQTPSPTDPRQNRQATALASAEVTVNDTRDDAPLNGMMSLSDLAMSGDFMLPPFTDGLPFPGADLDGTMTIGKLAFSFTAPKTAENPQTLALNYELWDIKSDGFVNAGAVAVVGAIPDVTASGQFSIGTYTYSMREPDASKGAISGSGKGFAGSVDVKVPALPEDAGLDEAVAKGLAIAARLDSASGDTQVNFKDSEIDGALSVSSGPGVLEFGLSKAGLIVDVTQSQTALTVRSDTLGGTYEGRLGETGMRIAMPVAKSDEAQPYAFALRMQDLTLGDTVWNLVDPQKQIPRTAATLIAEVSGGTAHVIGDAFAEHAPKDDLPFVPDALDLTRLVLAIGGAEIGGGGTLSFISKNDTVVPVGKIRLTWKGVYGLLGKLGSVEIFPPEAMFGLRGVIGMVSKAVGSDDLVSEFEFRADGSILANGTKLPTP